MSIPKNPLENSKWNSDEVLKKINQFITLKSEDIKKNNVIIDKVLHNILITQMKHVDKDFQQYYRNMNYSGSYYKKTKIGKPDEFNLNLIINLPLKINKCKISVNHDKHSFVKLEITEDSLKPAWFNTKFRKLLDPVTNCIDQNKFRGWIESVITKALKEIGNGVIVDGVKYELKVKKGGPAFNLTMIEGSNELNFDLVPCLEFTGNLPGYRYLLNSGYPMKWLAVPKPLYRHFPSLENNLFWRTSFYDYERDIIKRHGNVKPVIRCMKKLRDTQNWKCLASYYIETLFLEEIEDKKTDLSKKSMTQIFVYMLMQLQKSLENGKIKYFWHSGCNLLNQYHNQKLQEMSLIIRKIIVNLHNNIDNYDNVIAQILLTETEMTIFNGSVNENNIRSVYSRSINMGLPNLVKFSISKVFLFT